MKKWLPYILSILPGATFNYFWSLHSSRWMGFHEVASMLLLGFCTAWITIQQMDTDDD